MRWFHKEAHGREVVIYILVFLVFDLAYSISTVFLFEHPHLNREISSSQELKQLFTLELFPVLFVIFLLAALLEEVVFRLPLVIFVKLGWSVTKVLGVALLLSIIFGFLHGGVSHIYLQGVGGLLYSVIFLKCGGFQGNFSKAVGVSTAVHFLYNMTLILLIFILIQFE